MQNTGKRRIIRGNAEYRKEKHNKGNAEYRKEKHSMRRGENV